MSRSKFKSLNNLSYGQRWTTVNSNFRFHTQTLPLTHSPPQHPSGVDFLTLIYYIIEKIFSIVFMPTNSCEKPNADGVTYHAKSIFITRKMTDETTLVL